MITQEDREHACASIKGDDEKSNRIREKIMIGDADEHPAVQAASFYKSRVRRRAFLEAAEIASLTATDLRNGDKSRFTAAHIAMALKKKAEE